MPPGEVTRAAEREVEEARVVPQAGEEEEHGVDQRWLFAAGRLSGPRPASAFAFGARVCMLGLIASPQRMLR